MLSYPASTLADNVTAMAFLRDTNFNLNYTMKDAIQDPGGKNLAGGG